MHQATEIAQTAQHDFNGQPDDEHSRTPKRSESYLSSGHPGQVGRPRRLNENNNHLINGRQLQYTHQTHQQILQQQQIDADEGGEYQSQLSSSFSAGRRSTQPNRPSSQLTQLQRDRHMRADGYNHNDVASIVTTVNNNFDAAPSRALSNEISNETHSAEDGASGHIILQTQHHFPNLVDYPSVRHDRQDKRSNHKQNGTAPTESTIENNRRFEDDSGGFRSLMEGDSVDDGNKNRSPRILVQKFQTAQNLQQQQQFQLAFSAPLQVVHEPQRQSSFTNGCPVMIPNRSMNSGSLKPQSQQQSSTSGHDRRVIQVQTMLKDFKAQRNILREYEDEFESLADENSFQNITAPGDDDGFEEGKQSLQDLLLGPVRHDESIASGAMPTALEYHTFSLNPDQFNRNYHEIIVDGSQNDYLTHGLAINSTSNRNTDIEETQSFFKQVTGAFNNQFASQEGLGQVHRAETIETGGILSPKDFNLNFVGDASSTIMQRDKDIDEFINSTRDEDVCQVAGIANRHDKLDPEIIVDACAPSDSGLLARQGFQCLVELERTRPMMKMDDSDQLRILNDITQPQTQSSLQAQVFHQQPPSTNNKAALQHFQSLSFDLTKTTPAFKQKLARIVTTNGQQSSGTRPSKEQSLQKYNNFVRDSFERRQGSADVLACSSSKRSIQEQQINRLRNQLQAYENSSANVTNRDHCAPKNIPTMIRDKHYSSSDLGQPNQFQIRSTSHGHNVQTSMSLYKNTHTPTMNLVPHNASLLEKQSIIYPQTVNHKGESNTIHCCQLNENRCLKQNQVILRKNKLGSFPGQQSDQLRQEMQRSRANRAPSQIYRLQSLPLPDQDTTESKSNLKIPMKTPASGEQKTLESCSSLPLQQCPLKPQKPAYPMQIQFCKRNFSTGGDAKIHLQNFQGSGGKKVINLLGAKRQQKSNERESLERAKVKGSGGKFTLARKSQPQQISASLVQAQKRPGDKDTGLDDEAQFDEGPNDKASATSSKPRGFNRKLSAKPQKLPVHHNPYESFQESIIVNQSVKASNDSLLRHHNYFNQCYSGSSHLDPVAINNSQSCEFLEIVTNKNDPSVGKNINQSLNRCDDEIFQSSTSQGKQNQVAENDKVRLGGRPQCRSVEAVQAPLSVQKKPKQQAQQQHVRPFTSMQQVHADDVPQKVLRRPLSRGGDRKKQNVAHNHITKLSLPPSKFSHIKTISQIGAQPPILIGPSAGVQKTVANSSSESYFATIPSKQHKTHLSSISGLPNGSSNQLNGSSQTIPSPLLKFTSQKVTNDVCSSSSIQQRLNQKQRLTESSEANLASSSLQLNFQAEHQEKKSRRSRNQNQQPILCEERKNQHQQQLRTLEPSGVLNERSGSTNQKCGKAARKLKNIQNIFWTASDLRQFSQPSIQNDPKKCNNQTVCQPGTGPPAATINLNKLRKLAQNQKKGQQISQQASQQAAKKQTTGFKISVVDEHGIKNADFTDIGHLKFETVKNRGPPNFLVPTSKEEPMILMQTEERQQSTIFETHDNRLKAANSLKIDQNSINNNCQTYAHNRRNRYLIDSTQQAYARQASSVENNQPRGTESDAFTMATLCTKTSMAKKPPRLLNVRKENKADRPKKIKDGPQDEVYPLVSQEQNRRGRNFSQLPENRRRHDSLANQRRSLPKDSIFQQVDIDQLGIESTKTGKRANSLVSMLCCYSQKSKGFTALGNQRSSIDNQSIGSQDSICAIF